MNKRKINALETRKKLLEVGTKLINEKGFQNISVEDITNAAGVSKGTFYTYFKRKEDLVEHTWQSFTDIAEKAKANTELPLLENMKHFCCEFMAIIERYGLEVTKQWVRNVVDAQYDCDCRGEKYNFDCMVVADLLDSAMENDRLKNNTPVDVLSQLIVTQLYGVLLCWCITDGSVSPARLINDYCNVTLPGVLGTYLSEVQD